MSKPKGEQHVFPELCEKAVEVTFDAGKLSSDSGVILLGQADRRIGLVKALACSMADRRDARRTRHSLEDLLRQRILQIACGYEDCNDANVLRRDPAFKVAAGRSPDSGCELASQPTLSRLENSVSATDLYRMAKALFGLFVRSYQTPPRIIALDFDCAVDEAYGGQQGVLFNGFYDAHCFLPLHVYEGLSGKLITTVLRPGKTLNVGELLPVAKRVVRALRVEWPETEILVRADSHFAKPEFLAWLETQGPRVKYAIAISKNPVLNRLAVTAVEEAEFRFPLCGQPVRIYDEFPYAAGSWKKQERRIVVRALCSERGTDCRFVVTNLADPAPRTVYDHVYAPRGQAENHIKQHVRQLASDRTSCTSFLANQFRLLLHGAAYTLLHGLRDQLLRGTELARAELHTIQLRVLKVAARIHELATKIKVQVSSHFPGKSFFRRCAALLC